jgi:hypothetical protein
MSGGARWDQRVARKPPNGKSKPALLHSAAGIAVFMALVGLGSPQPIGAQTFDEASSRALREIIDNRWAKDALQRVLEQNAPAGVVSAAPATLTPQPTAEAAIERRLQAVRESEERRRKSGATLAVYASNPGDTVLADDRRLQLPSGAAASSEITVGMRRG